MKNVKCLRCVNCSKEYTATADATTCECGGILDVIYDYDYIKTVLDSTPKHVRKMQEFLMQYVCFSSDGWFILHCLHELVANGKLKPPTEEQKNALTTVVIC